MDELYAQSEEIIEPTTINNLMVKLLSGAHSIHIWKTYKS